MDGYAYNGGNSKKNWTINFIKKIFTKKNKLNMDLNKLFLETKF